MAALTAGDMCGGTDGSIFNSIIARLNQQDCDITALGQIN